MHANAVDGVPSAIKPATAQVMASVIGKRVSASATSAICLSTARLRAFEPPTALVPFVQALGFVPTPVLAPAILAVVPGTGQGPFATSASRASAAPNAM